MKHAYVVSIVELAPPAATNTREQPTQELGTIALAGGGPSLLSSQFGNASLLKRGGSSVSLLSVGTAGGGGGGGGGLDSHNDLDDVTGREREEEKEKRWTDDEDEDEDNTAAKTGGGSNGAVKTRVHRIDFSDESEDLNGFEDEAVDLMMDDDLSGEEDVVVRGVKTESKGGKSNKPSSRTKRNKTSLSLSSDTISFSDQSRSSPAKPGTPRFTRSRSGSITSIPIITAVERKRLVEERRLERAQSRIEANGDPMASTKTTLTQPKVKGKDTATTSRPSKRRVTAYGVYSKLERSKIKKENPTATSAEITSTLRSRFNLLKDVDRNHFHKLADEQNGNNEGVESESEDGEASSPVLNVIKTFPKKKRPLSDEGSSGSEEIPLVRIRPVRVIAASLDDAENVNNRQSASECGSPTLL
ncbi:hypothetical protein BDR26DRAFT_851940 [Obelidium mucronatum]|nr:hypothetical protein BDR26DRAFT_851940 [Obelidium mucronatum]